MMWLYQWLCGGGGVVPYVCIPYFEGTRINFPDLMFAEYRRNWIISACMGSIAELYTLIFENAPIMNHFEPHPTTGCLCDES